MYRSSLLARTVAVAGIAIAPLAVASTAQALSFVATQAPGEQSTSSIIGLNVENRAGDKLGDINYLVLDNSGKVSTVVIGVGGFLGVGTKNVGIPYSELTFSTKDGHQIATVDATKESLASAPNYVWTEKSAMEKFKDGAAELTDKAKDAAGVKPSATKTSSE
jgi:hypothetical protein